MKGKIQTVLGPIEPERAGFTLTHEHLTHALPKCVFLQPPEANLLRQHEPLCLENLKWIRQYPYCFEDNIEFGDAATRLAVAEEVRFLAGCRDSATIVDNCSVGLRAPDHPSFLRTLSQETGVNIVMGTGFYVEWSQSPPTLSMTQEQMEELIRADITGVSGARCGVIGEIGCSWPLLPFERRSLAASASVQVETGCPVILHPGRDRAAPAEILRVFAEAGGKVGKAVMSHLDRTFLSEDELLEFASLGSFCEFDLFGTEVSHYQLDDRVDMPSDAQRIALMRHLMEHGFGDKLLASHDIHTKHRLAKFGGHGFSHILLSVVPKMLKRGFTADDVDRIFLTNPRKWLTFE